MSDRLRVGVIGCGEVVQAVHRPVLLGLRRSFQIVACADQNVQVAEAFAESTSARPMADPFELVDSADVDVVLVAAPDGFHAEFLMAACDAKKKAVLVEKPLTMNLRMAEQVRAAVKASSTKVVVGCPHLFDPAVDRAQTAWSSAELSLGEFYTVIGPNDRFVADVAEVERPEGPRSFGTTGMDYALAATERLGGRISFADVGTFALLHGLNIHDLPVMRRLLGEPDEVVFAERLGSRGLHAVFRYGRGRVYLNTLIQTTRQVDWGFRLRSPDKTVGVAYPTTYAPTAESICTLTEGVEGAIHMQSWRGSYVTGFRREWEHLKVLVDRDEQNTDGLDGALRDLALCEDIMKALIQ